MEKVIMNKLGTEKKSFLFFQECLIYEERKTLSMTNE